MSTKDDIEVPKSSLKERCVECLRGPNLIKTVVVIVCMGVMIVQFSSCINKLINTPITTYTHFDFNRTLLYPSVTLCREPAYKYDKLLEYDLYAHPLYTSTWRNFNFTNVTLDDLWDDITYNSDDYFVQYGLDSSTNNVEVKPVMGFYNGRCYTLSPKNISTKASRGTGYTITLQHTAEDLVSNVGTYPAGYHVYLHYVREPFTEVEVKNGGLVEYIYVVTGETVDIKLTVNQYTKLSEIDDPCTNEADYNANECTTKLVWKMVEEAAGCSGPWMESQLPRCNNYNDMRNLISSYLNNYQDHNHTDCPRFCCAFLYNAFVVNRQDGDYWHNAPVKSDASLQTQLYINFNSMMVSVYEERHNYDWNLFVSDIGGSVGFLLGLSVIGLMAIVGKVWATIVRPLIKVPKSKKDVASIAGSVETRKPRQNDDFLQKCDDWNTSNNFMD